MKLSPSELEEVNVLLSKENLGFPDYRRVIDASGGNCKWVQKALSYSGAGSARLRELLAVKDKVVSLD